jgi:hypothetical protein
MSDQFPQADVTMAKSLANGPAVPKVRARLVVPGETKRQKFVRLVDPRVTRAIAAIRRIGKLSANRSRYEWGQEDVDKIVGALEAEVEAVARKMIRPSRQLPLFSIEAK